MKIGITLTSSLHVGQEYIDLTKAVARNIAKEKHGIVYGGTAYGMMLELAEAYKQAGGRQLIGVLAKDLMAVTKNYEAYQKLDQTFTYETLGERKEKIASYADALLILPGGYGTIEECIDYLGGKVNKLYDKPIAIYNHKGFYDTLIRFFDELVQKQFTKIKLSEVVLVSENLDEIMKYFANYRAVNLVDKFV